MFTKRLPGDHPAFNVRQQTSDRPQALHGMRIRPAAITLALLAIVAGLAAAAALPSSAQAADPCWMRVQNDWLADGTIDGHYSVKCLQQAEKNVAMLASGTEIGRPSRHRALRLMGRYGLRGVSPADLAIDGTTSPTAAPAPAERPRRSATA